MGARMRVEDPEGQSAISPPGTARLHIHGAALRVAAELQSGPSGPPGGKVTPSSPPPQLTADTINNSTATSSHPMFIIFFITFPLTDYLYIS